MGSRDFSLTPTTASSSLSFPLQKGEMQRRLFRIQKTVSRFIETAFNLFDVTGDGHITAKVFVLIIAMTVVMVMTTVLMKKMMMVNW